MSMIETLPVWIKSARNQDAVLAATVRLGARLDDQGRPPCALDAPHGAPTCADAALTNTATT